MPTMVAVLRSEEPGPEKCEIMDVRVLGLYLAFAKAGQRPDMLKSMNIHKQQPRNALALQLSSLQ
jgi:hypothetical protein